MSATLEKRRRISNLRNLRNSLPGSIDFSSNDFLSLGKSPLTRQSYLSALTNTPPTTFRLGSGGSRLLDGNSVYAEQLESELAIFHRANSALLFNSGYDANTGFFACVPQTGDLVFYDALIHASVHEGLKLSRAGKVCSFSHNSVDDLRIKISEVCEKDNGVRDGTKNVFVAVEALYSMDGDLAHLSLIVDLLENLLPKGNGCLVVDEAHSNGLYGEKGRGLVCKLGLEEKVFARLHTFGKALACNGGVCVFVRVEFLLDESLTNYLFKAAILCDTLVRQYLINYAKPLIYTTSMSFPSLVAISSVYKLMKQGATLPLISHLEVLTAYLFKKLNTLSPYITHPHTNEILLVLPLEAPQSPIFSLLTPYPRSLAAHCQAIGFVVRPIMPPTVPKGTQRVRICLHAGNTFKEIEELVQCILLWLEKEHRKRVRTPHESLLKAVL